MFEQLGRGVMAVRVGATVVAVGLLVLTAAGAGATVGGGHAPVGEHSADGPTPVQVYEHETDAGETLHTIELAPTAVDPPSDDVLGVVVLPEQDRVCRAVAGESYAAEGAGCTQDASTVEAYLDAAGVERTEDGAYAV